MNSTIRKQGNIDFTAGVNSPADTDLDVYAASDSLIPLILTLGTDPDDTIAEAREIGNETINDGLTETTDVDM